LFTSVVRDVSERKDAEERLKRQAWVMDNIADAVIITNSNGKIDACNSAAEDLTGYPRNELIGMTVMDLMVADTEAQRYSVQTDARSVTDSGGVWRHEFKVRRKDGAVRIFYNTTSSMFDDRGRLVGRISVNRDVTEQREVDRMKQEFISVVSHELRTPLTSIMGSLGLIKSGAMGEVAGDVKGMIDIAHSNSDRLVRLINDILDLEKIEAGRMEFKSEQLDVHALVSDAARDNAGVAETNDVDVIIGEDVPHASVLADRDKLAQVFANLLSNAIKFSPEGGLVELGAKRRNGRIHFFVRDQGPGIPPEFHDKIFTKFSQADSSATRKKGGTGLGLSICKTIVEKLGGQIGFESEAGKGTCFFFELDESAAEEAPEKTVVPSSSVMVATADANAATFLQVMLEDMGLRVTLAATRQEAKAWLDGTAFDLVIVDLSSKGEWGLDTIGDLSASPFNKGTPVFILSGRNQEKAEFLDSIALDMAGWITKPIDITVLKDLLSKVVRDDIAVRPNVLHVEDDKDIVEVVRKLMGGRANIVAAESLAEARAQLKRGADNFDLVLLDLALGDGRGEELLPELTTTDGRCIPVVVFSANDLDKTAVTGNRVSVLEKSRTSNDALAASILSALDRKRRA
jgi:PAS domain S-box-containing protein